MLGPADQVVPLDRRVMVEPEAPVRPPPLRLEPGAVRVAQRERGAVVDRRPAAAELHLALELQLLRRLIGRIGAARPPRAAPAPPHNGRTAPTGDAPRRRRGRARPDPRGSPRHRPRSLRSRSVSSILRMKRPPCLRAHSQLCSAVRILPTWSRPVGEGAKRVTTDMAGLYSRGGAASNALAFAGLRPKRGDSRPSKGPPNEIDVGQFEPAAGPGDRRLSRNADHRGERAPLRRRGDLRRDPRERPRRGRVRASSRPPIRPTTI